MADAETHLFSVLAALSKAAEESYTPDLMYEAFRSLDEVEKLTTPATLHVIQPICWAIRTSAAFNIRSSMGEKRPVKSEASVYFAQKSDGLIKIGFANDVDARMKQISAMAGSELTVLATTDGGERKEKSLHKRFQSAKCHGEWFHPTSEVLSFVDELNRKGGHHD
jgi:hypothetical protein